MSYFSFCTQKKLLLVRMGKMLHSILVCGFREKLPDEMKKYWAIFLGRMSIAKNSAAVTKSSETISHVPCGARAGVINYLLIQQHVKSM